MASSTKIRFARLGVIAVALAGLVACDGVIGSAPETGSTPGNPGTTSGTTGGTSGGTTGGAGSGSTTGGGPNVNAGPGLVVMHRLNFSEYNNTVRDLLKTNIRLPDVFPPDDSAYGFDNVASILSVTDVHLRHYQNTAAALASEALSPARRASLVTCDPATQKEACVTTVVNSFVPRAWRRPLADTDRTKLVQLYTARVAAGDTADDALGRVFQAVLLSPRFLYRIEENRDPSASAPRALDSYEMASRLSYFLWSSMPDDELFRAAAADELTNEANVSAQVRRIMSDSKSAAFIQNFGAEWLGQRNLDNIAPDPTAFKTFDEDLRSAMRQETLLLFREVASGSIPAGQLLTANFSFMNDRLAAHYGLPPVGSKTPVRTAVPRQRGGLLTNASLLSVLAHPNETAPVLRGKWILSHLLCQDVPPPPPNVPKEPAAKPSQSRRERLASHRVEAVCASCHGLMDPLGLSFEKYDGIGAMRTTDNGVAIDTADTVPGLGSFSGPEELANLIVKSPDYARCITKHIFIYALGRAERDGNRDAAAIDAITKTFVDRGSKFPDLIETLALSNVFRQRQDEAPAPSLSPGAYQ
jgi:hypothetical protein